MKRVLTFGVFDLLHYGHVRLFERAKQLDEEAHLIVAVQRDSAVNKYKPDAVLKCNEDIRTYMVNSVRYVDEVVFYSDVDIDIQKYDFDILCLGADQIHAGFQRAIEYCKAHDKVVIVLERTKGISSSMLR